VASDCRKTWLVERRYNAATISLSLSLHFAKIPPHCYENDSQKTTQVLISTLGFEFHVESICAVFEAAQEIGRKKHFHSQESFCRPCTSPAGLPFPAALPVLVRFLSAHFDALFQHSLQQVDTASCGIQERPEGISELMSLHSHDTIPALRLTTMNRHSQLVASPVYDGVRVVPTLVRWGCTLCF
jgi:hypothetical protein